MPLSESGPIQTRAFSGVTKALVIRPRLGRGLSRMPPIVIDKDRTKRGLGGNEKAILRAHSCPVHLSIVSHLHLLFHLESCHHIHQPHPCPVVFFAINFHIKLGRATSATITDSAHCQKYVPSTTFEPPSCHGAHTQEATVPSARATQRVSQDHVGQKGVLLPNLVLLSFRLSSADSSPPLRDLLHNSSSACPQRPCSSS